MNKTPPTIDERLAKIEKKFCGDYTPGTQLVRTLLDAALCKREQISLESWQGQRLVWGLAVGRLQEPKLYFYGPTIEEVLLRAERSLEGKDW